MFIEITKEVSNNKVYLNTDLMVGIIDTGEMISLDLNLADGAEKKTITFARNEAVQFREAFKRSGLIVSSRSKRTNPKLVN